MTSIEQAARLTIVRREPAGAPQRHLSWGTRCLAAVRVDSSVDARPRPEDVARSEVFFNSTCCWV